MSEENNLQALSGTGNEQDNSKNKSIYTDNRKNELKIDEIQIGDRDNRRTVFNILGLGDVTIVALVAIVVIFALVVIITQPWTWQQLKSEPKVDSQSSGKSVIQHPHTNSFVGSKKVKVIPEIVSSLGMRFIVVDEGASLYVSEFETRVKDYRAFHKEVPSPAITRSCQAYGVTFSGRWEKPNLPQQDPENHPVVWVTLNEAKAFCEWLTNKERKARAIPQDWSYRLPLASEWKQTFNQLYGDGSTLIDSSNENLCDLSLERYKAAHPEFPFFNATQQPNSLVLKEPGDGSPATSPVGQASKLSSSKIKDLAGNVYEWLDAAAVGGGCWATWFDSFQSLEQYLINEIGPDKASPLVGFRVVLSPSLPTEPSR